MALGTASESRNYFAAASCGNERGQTITSSCSCAILIESFSGDVRSLQGQYGRNDMAPILWKKGRLSLSIVSGPPADSSWSADQPSWFHISYTSQPAKTLPRKAHPDFYERDFSFFDDLRNTSTPYDCSFSSSVSIPSALRCNFVLDCLGGEDERGCSYHSLGCPESWVPFGTICLRLLFYKVLDHAPGAMDMAAPVEAQKFCRKTYQAELAEFSNMNLVQLVTRMVRDAGFRTVSARLFKMYLRSGQQRHLYRFLWQWGGRGSPVAHEVPFPTLPPAGSSCAALHAFPVPGLQPSYCGEIEVGSDQVDGFVCVKPNPAAASTVSAAMTCATPSSFSGVAASFDVTAARFLLVAAPDTSNRTQTLASSVAPVDPTKMEVVDEEDIGDNDDEDINAAIAVRDSGSDAAVCSAVAVHLPAAVVPSPDLRDARRCPDGSLVHQFHPCSWKGSALLRPAASVLPQFPCRYGPHVHYSLVCDGLEDCHDGSDEVGCPAVLRFEPLQRDAFVCENLQIINRALRCNGQPNCFDESDEAGCEECASYGLDLCSGLGCLASSLLNAFPQTCPQIYKNTFRPQPTSGPRYLVQDGSGVSQVKLFGNGEELSRDFFFHCGEDFHIPAYLLNNGEQDCLYGQDEKVDVDSLTCPGYYRCLGTGSCLLPEFFCDGIDHCPEKDDERYCPYAMIPAVDSGSSCLAVCPAGCRCQGFAYTCSCSFDPACHLLLRYLDLSGVDLSCNLTRFTFHYLELLQFLNLSSCSLQRLVLGDMPKLNILDVSFNELSSFSGLTFSNLTGLTYLDLSGNPIVSTLDATFGLFFKASGVLNLESLILRQTGLSSLKADAFAFLTKLKKLDLRDNDVQTFHPSVFRGLGVLEQMKTDDSRLCCLVFHTSSTLNCQSPEDELSSCSDLLRSNFFRICLWTIAGLAVAGNLTVIVYRIFISSTIKCSSRASSVSRILVCNLSGSDLLMGVYLAIVGSADAYYRNAYVSHEMEWRNSLTCRLTGCLAFLSNEVSSFNICLITLDRLLALCFPLKRPVHMKVNHARYACVGVWVAGGLLAAVPILSSMEFYEQTAVCLPLPITRRRFSGYSYALAVLIELSFVLLVLVAVGQFMIFRELRRSSQRTESQRRQRDADVARRLFLVVLSNFCCWFPVGLLGFLSMGGLRIPGEVSVWVAIFILPINAAINPFLYTLSGLHQRCRKRAMERKTKFIVANLHTELARWTPETLEEVTKVIASTKRLPTERLAALLGIGIVEKAAIASSTASASSACQSPTASHELVTQSPAVVSAPSSDGLTLL